MDASKQQDGKNGDRRFSPWKGSVVDSVVGVFLTQNVSDHLSSSAFMALAAKFPSGYSSQPNPERTNKSYKEGPISSFIETNNLQVKPPGIELFDCNSVVIQEVFEEKQTDSQSSHLAQQPSRDGLLGSKDEGMYFNEIAGHLSPDSKTDTIFTTSSSINMSEGEDKGSLEQKSIISSQDSSEYLVQLADQGETGPGSNNESEDLVNGNMCNSLDSYTSFTELLKMAEVTQFQNFHSHGSGGISSSECCCVINEFTSTEAERESLIQDLKDKPNGACFSAAMPGNSDYFGHDFISIASNPCTSYHHRSSSNFMLVEATVSEAEERTHFPFTAPVIPTRSIETENEAMPSSGTQNGATVQKESLTSKAVSLADKYAFAEKRILHPVDSSDIEICFNQISHNKQLLRERGGGASAKRNSQNKSQLHVRQTAKDKQKGGEVCNLEQKSQLEADISAQIEVPTMCPSSLGSHNNPKQVQQFAEATEPNPKAAVSSSNKTPIRTATNGPKATKVKPETEKQKNFDWDSLRKQACPTGDPKERSSNQMDSLDWEAVRQADVNEISKTIRERGMNNMLAERIKDFLNRLVRDHGSIDLEWLRDIPPDKAKDYLLSIRGLGLKSVECVRLLTLHHLAFPVDTNVGRISVRLGWVPLQPLPESLQLHLLEMYPILETIQKYLWPRLCTLDQQTLYELHYQLITFGKVFCTKAKPNCNACPMRGECKHFASAFASARRALPGPDEKKLATSTAPIAPKNKHSSSVSSIPFLQLERHHSPQAQNVLNNCEPIIEEPATPEPEVRQTSETAIEDDLDDDPNEIPTIKLNLEEFTQNLHNYMQKNNLELQEGDISKALVVLAPEAASIPMPKLKNVGRLRTEHQVYELPDSHPLLEGRDRRQPDDPCSYLLAIWTPGETAESTEPPEISCNSQETGILCDKITCFACNSIRETQTQTIRGTLLIPCRTAMRGSFPLNGTYFQVNEVFADHESSHNPVNVPRKWIWNLPRRTVYFGTSVPTIFRGLSTEQIQHCFWRGFVCLRGFDRATRAPRPLNLRLHSPASKTPRNKNTSMNKEE